MQLRYNFRLHPTRLQQQALGRAFGCARVARMTTETSGDVILRILSAAEGYGDPERARAEFAELRDTHRVTFTERWIECHELCTGPIPHLAEYRALDVQGG